jgi:hypothetical protein
LRKKASAIGSPATLIASRLCITPVNTASCGITAAQVMSPISPRSSASGGADERVEVEAGEGEGHGSP